MSAAGGSPSSTITSSMPAEPPDRADGLTAGLLPADACGEQVAGVPLSREQLRQSADLAADPDTRHVSPDACREVLTSAQPPIDDHEDVAARSATVSTTTTVEVLLEGELTPPGPGRARHGDAMAAVRFTTTPARGGQDVSVGALVRLVQDGDRLVTLLTIATDGSSVDAAAFTSLLVQAFEVQAEELG